MLKEESNGEGENDKGGGQVDVKMYCRDLQHNYVPPLLPSAALTCPFLPPGSGNEMRLQGQQLGLNITGFFVHWFS